MEVFKKLGRSVDRLGAFASIIGVAILIVTNISSWLADSTSPAIAFAIQNGLFIVALFIWAMYYMRVAVFLRRKLAQAKRPLVYEKIHSFCHFHRDASSQIKQQLSSNQSDAKHRIGGFLVETCNLLKDIFEHLTNENCAVTVKTLIDEKTVVTAARDRESWQKRKESNRFPITDNTAFGEIHKYSKDHFLHNNLSSDRHYHNTNPGWQDFYNCTLVVPIRCNKGGVPPLVGYLAIDCKPDVSVEKNEIFNNKEHKEIMGIFADTLYLFIEKVSPFYSNPQIQKEELK